MSLKGLLLLVGNLGAVDTVFALRVEDAIRLTPFGGSDTGFDLV